MVIPSGGVEFMIVNAKFSTYNCTRTIELIIFIWNRSDVFFLGTTCTQKFQNLIYHHLLYSRV